MDRKEQERLNRQVAAEQESTLRRPVQTIRVGRASREATAIGAKMDTGAPENKMLDGPDANKAGDSATDDGNIQDLEFASAAAMDTAERLGVKRSVLRATRGTGKDGRYTVADVRAAAGVSNDGEQGDEDA